MPYIIVVGLRVCLKWSTKLRLRAEGALKVCIAASHPYSQHLRIGLILVLEDQTRRMIDNAYSAIALAYPTVGCFTNCLIEVVRHPIIVL